MIGTTILLISYVGKAYLDCSLRNIRRLILLLNPRWTKNIKTTFQRFVIILFTITWKDKMNLYFNILIIGIYKVLVFNIAKWKMSS